MLYLQCTDNLDLLWFTTSPSIKLIRTNTTIIFVSNIPTYSSLICTLTTVCYIVISIATTVNATSRKTRVL